MKKIIYLSLFSIALFSCDDKDIDLHPYDAFGEQLTFENKADFESAVSPPAAVMYTCSD